MIAQQHLKFGRTRRIVAITHAPGGALHVGSGAVGAASMQRGHCARRNAGIGPINQLGIGQMLPHTEHLMRARINLAVSIAVTGLCARTRIGRRSTAIARIGAIICPTPEGHRIGNIARQRVVFLGELLDRAGILAFCRHHRLQMRGAQQILPHHDAANEQPHHQQRNSNLNQRKSLML